MNIRKVSDYKAPASKVLLEMLSPQEAAGSALVTVGKSTQGRIIDIGPALRAEIDKYGFAVGDRVLLQGSFVPVPSFPGGDTRELVIVDPHMIQCVLVEEPETEKKCCGGKCKGL